MGARVLLGCRGQSSVEYALVVVAFLAVVLALAALWHAASSGTLLGLAVDAASHAAGSSLGSLAKDVALY